MPIIDTDLLAREVVAPGLAAARRRSPAHFGADVLAADGSLDRARAARRAFSPIPPSAQWLEALTHPAIRAAHRRALQRRAAAPTRSSRSRCWSKPAAPTRFDRVLVVDCDESCRFARLQARDGTTREQAQRMLARPGHARARLAVADDVIHNDGDLAALRDQVEKLHRQYVGREPAAQSDKAAMSSDDRTAECAVYGRRTRSRRIAPMAAEEQPASNRPTAHRQRRR